MGYLQCLQPTGGSGARALLWLLRLLLLLLSLLLRPPLEWQRSSALGVAPEP